ncbi:glycoside hydrolase family 16 protein [Rheinheimera sp.]|uniref:glycoside hydrolase family 16 protein n=1 Tax=Rheinheimera sp. TaxID=1869214 RepID=UPI002357E355|nr:glycoside hydrolase family 16 protein [Rheinheimera sp.]
MKTTAKLATVACAVMLASTLQGCGGSAETKSNFDDIDVSQPVTDWVMVWNDEFDGTAINSNNWNYEINCAGGGNNEKQCYTDSADNAFIKDGVLNIVALPAAEGAEKPYTSARLTTQNKADFKFGRFEMRAKLPYGQGSWPAFWMMPTDSVYGGWPRSGEIDIMEAVNLKVVGDDGVAEANVHGTLHYGREWPNNLNTGKAYQLPDGMNPADDFHTYAVEWQEGEIRWYVDGYLFATQRQSKVRYNSKGEADGLSQRGWFAEYFNQSSGELEVHWDAAPFDQEFFMILNLAVGGNWPENVNNLGVDAAAFADGQRFEIDYVRVYECAANPSTGKGCETIRPGYEDEADALVTGLAPIPTAAAGLVQSVSIFDGTPNPNWAAWDCCGGTTPALVADAERGDVYEFSVAATPTVNGFTSREEFITDPQGVASPFDASGIVEIGYIRFDMQVTSMPNNAAAPWLFKVESIGAGTAVELDITASSEGAAPASGQWQTYTFPLQMLADAGLDVSAIDVVMIFPAWGQGEGAVYRVDNVEITLDYPELTLFADQTNPDWPMWDCCGGSVPTEEVDDATHGTVAEFRIGATPTVMGFNNRTSSGGSGEPFDAGLLRNGGIVQFEMKLVSAPADASAGWLFKIEADNAATAVEVSLTTSVEGVAPVVGQWQTYTFNVADLLEAGLDISAIDVLMVFPAWGQGEGAIYRLDNVVIKQP